MTLLVGSVFLLLAVVFVLLAFLPMECPYHANHPPGEYRCTCLSCFGTRTTSRYKIGQAHRLLKEMGMDPK
jgi:hypothetical protein